MSKKHCGINFLYVLYVVSFASKIFSFDAYEKQEMAPNYFEFPLQRNDGAGHQSHAGAHKYITPFKHCTLVNYIFVISSNFLEV
jgi:hypothetical protein